MDSELVKQQVDKYWNCQTTVEEERELCQYFNSGDIPSDLGHAAELFRYFEHEKSKTSTKNFEMKVAKRYQKPLKERSSWLGNMKSVYRIVAGIFVLVVATFLVRNEIEKSYSNEIIDTYVDPKLAFEETKKALLQISESFGKAKSEATKINMFKRAEQKVKENL